MARREPFYDTGGVLPQCHLHLRAAYCRLITGKTPAGTRAISDTFARICKGLWVWDIRCIRASEPELGAYIIPASRATAREYENLIICLYVHCTVLHVSQHTLLSASRPAHSFQNDAVQEYIEVNVYQRKTTSRRKTGGSVDSLKYS